MCIFPFTSRGYHAQSGLVPDISLLKVFLSAGDFPFCDPLRLACVAESRLKGGMTLRACHTGPHVPKRPQLWFRSIFLYEICYTSSWDNTEQIKITLKENNQKRVERLNNKGRSNAPWNRTKRYAILSEFGSSESSL